MSCTQKEGKWMWADHTSASGSTSASAVPRLTLPLLSCFFFFLENFYCVFIQISPQSQILLNFFSLKLPSHLHINELKITPTDFYDGSPSPTKRRLIDAKFIFKKISKNFKKNLNLICIRVTVNGRVVINEGTGNRTR